MTSLIITHAERRKINRWFINCMTHTHRFSVKCVCGNDCCGKQEGWGPLMEHRGQWLLICFHLSIQRTSFVAYFPLSGVSLILFSLLSWKPIWSLVLICHIQKDLSPLMFTGHLIKQICTEGAWKGLNLNPQWAHLHIIQTQMLSFNNFHGSMACCSFCLSWSKLFKNT